VIAIQRSGYLAAAVKEAVVTAVHSCAHLLCMLHISDLRFHQLIVLICVIKVSLRTGTKVE
jgi:hypothetical protein